MKRLSLLFAMIAFLAGNVFAQTVLINDDMEAYTVGNKIAVEAQAAGNDFWTTWSNNPGSAEDGVVAEMGGTKCGHLTFDNDQAPRPSIRSPTDNNPACHRTPPIPGRRFPSPNGPYASAR